MKPTQLKFKLTDDVVILLHVVGTDQSPSSVQGCHFVLVTAAVVRLTSQVDPTVPIYSSRTKKMSDLSSLLCQTKHGTRSQSWKSVLEYRAKGRLKCKVYYEGSRSISRAPVRIRAVDGSPWPTWSSSPLFIVDGNSIRITFLFTPSVHCLTSFPHIINRACNACTLCTARCYEPLTKP